MRFRNDLPAELIQHTGSDAMIVNAARVSTGADRVQVGGPDHREEADTGLLRFLMRNRHGSPFEHGSMTFRIEAPIFVAREFMRHRVGWSYNEESGRYKTLDGVFYLPDKERPLIQVGRPGHYEYEMGSDHLHANLSRKMRYAYRVCWTVYTALLVLGVAKEVARMVLPVGIYTSFYATCNPRSLMHFLSLRTKSPEALFPSYPMQEIAQVAAGMEQHFAALYPQTHEAWNAAGRVAP